MTVARSPYKRHVGQLAREAQRRQIQAQHLIRQAARAEGDLARARQTVTNAEAALANARQAAGLSPQEN